ncbi:MAG: Protein of unknown function (DUF1523) [Rhodobacteraceae bacterium HLUCCO18]|nr:MAG: Protein of unknown function (DUF1523) [Rhodobacteraceae bacterium HLUCCO18]
MRWPRIIFLSLVILLIGAFLHYTLPQRDVVRIVNAESILTELDGWNRIFYASADAGASGRATSRDVRFINTVEENGNTRVYRNEDTSVLWPPYFKFDSQDLQTEAQNLISSADDPQWVSITHYGWRLNVFSIYPNAVAITPVSGPDVTSFPWINIVILLGMVLVIFMAWRIWERFEDRVIEPFVDSVAVRWAKMKDWAAGRR